MLLHEWRQVRGGGGGSATAILFLFAVVAIAAFAIGADLVQLARTGPAIVWIAALLASLLGAERAVAEDVEDGTFDTLRVAGVDGLAYAAAKVLARWAFVLLPLVVLSPFAGLLLAMPGDAVIGTTFTLLVGSPALAALSILGAAISTATRDSAILGPVVALPLLVPIVVFGSGAATAWGTDDATTPLLLLAATSLVATVATPVAVGALLEAD